MHAMEIRHKIMENERKEERERKRHHTSMRKGYLRKN